MSTIFGDAYLDEVIANAIEEIEERKRLNLIADNFFFDEEDAVAWHSRKRDWHKNKGKRRIKGGYKGDRYI